MRLPKWFNLIITWVLVFCFLVIGAVIINLISKNNGDFKQTPTSVQHNVKSSKLQWGIDTAANIQQLNYQCITKNYGKPGFVGRYLGNVKDVSKGLTKDEVNFLHKNKIKILPIYNHFAKATGLENGKKEARNAIKLAKAIGVKDGVVIMADIEPKFSVDSDFIIGWTETILQSKYMPGVYGDLGNDNLVKAYNAAAKKNKSVKNELILWTNQPSSGITTKDKAPNNFKGKSPNDAKTLSWQYGIKAKHCNIDTDLAKEKLLKFLW